MFRYICRNIKIKNKKQKREAFRGLSVPTNEGGDDPILKKRLEKEKKYVHWAI